MIDLKRLRDEPDYRAAIERKRVVPGLIDELLARDEERRVLTVEVEQLRARQNAASKEIGQADPSDRPAKIAAATELKEQLAALEPQLASLAARTHALALALPNPADASVPDGGEDEGDVLRIIGGTPAAPPLDHADYGLSRGWVDTDHAGVSSGSRFAYLMRGAVVLELALFNWVMTILGREGFVPVSPPVLVRERTLEEAGFFPTDRATVYEVGNDEDLFLVGTSEAPLSALHRQETIDVDDLPLRYAGVSSCFRREAGTYGKDTRGIFRVHQFDKVEMFSFCAPDRSWEEHERLLAIEETILGGLELPYRVVNIAAGDLGNPAAKKYDLEVWLPSEGRYRELTSCSNYLDYSARRLGTRVRTAVGTEPLHTLNGTACAISRTLVFLMEHGQEPDGTFRVPPPLVPYVGSDTL